MELRVHDLIKCVALVAFALCVTLSFNWFVTYITLAVSAWYIANNYVAM